MRFEGGERKGEKQRIEKRARREEPESNRAAAAAAAAQPVEP